MYEFIINFNFYFIVGKKYVWCTNLILIKKIDKEWKTNNKCPDFKILYKECKVQPH